MKNIFLINVLLSAFLISSCAKKILVASAPPVVSTTKEVLYVPFTKQLRQRIENNNLDIKKIQFFVDQQLIMRRTLGTEKADVKSGELLFEKGQYINEVVIPAFTPGVLENIAGDRMKISFEIQNNEIEFAALGDNTFYRLVGSNWNNANGSADIVYENKVYRVVCGSCSSAGDAKLVVIKKEIDKMDNKKRIVQGRKITEN
ncbi:MAG: hypothetical protein NVSMB45_11400 [Ginsengibacter sp.]